MEMTNRAGDADLNLIWPTIADALGVEIRPDNVVRGASGLEHHVQAIAVDEKSSRLVIVSSEANPRIAAMMQADVQASLPGSKVLVARPISIDLVGSIGKIAQAIGLSTVDIKDARNWLNKQKSTQHGDENLVIPSGVEGVLQKAIGPVSKLSVGDSSFFMNLVYQASALPWQEIMAIFAETTASGALDFNKLAASDNMEADLAVGICPIPLYEFTNEDVESMIIGKDVDRCRQRLIDMNIYQYFYPSPDQIVLGVIDRGVSAPQAIMNAAAEAPVLGHPFGDVELIPSASKLADTLDRLSDLGYIAEGEHGVEISDAGTTIRSSMKFRPREGLLTKILNRVSLSASISGRDFLT